LGGRGGAVGWTGSCSPVGLGFESHYRHGEGVYRWPGGSRFVGKFYLNEREGYGTQYFSDGTVFQVKAVLNVCLDAHFWPRDL
uniref:MORN repeat-containing protein 2-like n=1 Tax=Scleropages formosus TaxID=113540 RepID=A0A8C9WEP5_SCLFO